MNIGEMDNDYREAMQAEGYTPALVRYITQQQVCIALHNEFYRLRQMDIVPDVADLMEVIGPFLK